MFSIYGVSGRVFSGTLEAMDRVHRLARARSVRAIDQDGDEFGVEAVIAHPSREAVRAYRNMLPEELERGPLVHASQVMSRPAITVQDEATAADAWRTLHGRYIRQAPVLDAKGKLIGIVSERDLLTAIDVNGDTVVENLRRLVRDVMTTPVVATAPVTDIRRVAAVMLEGGVDGVPIIGDEGRLLGFVSRSDVLRAVINDPPLSLWR